MPDLPPQVDMVAIARHFVGLIPQAVELGLDVVAITPGEAQITMPYDAKLVGDPVTGVIHGGAVFTLMDTCAGAAVLSHPQAAPSTATLDLRVDYMRPATPHQAIRAHAICHHVTRTVAFVRITACDDDTSRPVASAVGAFTMNRSE